MDAFLPKPFSMDELANAVLELQAPRVDAARDLNSSLPRPNRPEPAERVERADGGDEDGIELGEACEGAGPLAVTENRNGRCTGGTVGVGASNRTAGTGGGSIGPIGGSGRSSHSSFLGGAQSLIPMSVFVTQALSFGGSSRVVAAAATATAAAATTAAVVPQGSFGLQRIVEAEHSQFSEVVPGGGGDEDRLKGIDDLDV